MSETGVIRNLLLFARFYCALSECAEPKGAETLIRADFPNRRTFKLQACSSRDICMDKCDAACDGNIASWWGSSGNVRHGNTISEIDRRKLQAF